MARSMRIEFPGAVYLISDIAPAGRTIMQSDDARLQFLTDSLQWLRVLIGSSMRGACCQTAIASSWRRPARIFARVCAGSAVVMRGT